MNAVWHNKNEKELKKRKMACFKVKIPHENNNENINI